MSSKPPPPERAEPLWWVRSPGADTAVSGQEFIAAWYREMSEPKPNKNAYVPEVAGWSGLFGDRDWVAGRYGARPAELARGGGVRITPVDEPAHWTEVTRLYTDYVDPFARFSGSYAEAVDCLRPKGLPQEVYGWVRPLKNRVPRAVRKAMADPVDGRFGGLIESSESADEFLTDTEEYVTRYGFVAGRRYLTVLRERATKLRDTGGGDESVLAVIEATIAEYEPHFGAADLPRRRQTQVEIDLVHTILMEKVTAQPGLRKNPHFGEAYDRAARTLLGWVIDGRENLDGGILFTALKWVRAEKNRSEKSSRVVLGLPDAEAQGVVGRSADSALEARSQLAAARIVLESHIEPDAAKPVGSWEKAFALRLLEDDSAVVFEAFGTFTDLLYAAWHGALTEGMSRPAGAITSDPKTAARYVQMLLAVAVSAVPHGGRNASCYARRLKKVESELVAHREDTEPDDEESAS